MKKTNKIFLQSSSVLATLITLAPMGMNVVANADDNTGGGIRVDQPTINNIKDNGGKANSTDIISQNGFWGNNPLPKTITIRSTEGTGSDHNIGLFTTDDPNFQKPGDKYISSDIMVSFFNDKSSMHVFCMEPANSDPSNLNENVAQILNPQQQSGVIQALYYGIKGNASNPGMPAGMPDKRFEDAYAATQAAIWHYSTGHNYTPYGYAQNWSQASSGKGITVGAPGADQDLQWIEKQVDPNIPLNQLAQKLGLNANEQQDLAKAKQQLNQMVAQQKQKMLQQLGFATEALDGQQSNSDSNETPESSSSNSNGSSTSDTAGLAKNNTPTSNASSATTQKPSAKNYNKYDNDLDNPNKKFTIHAGKVDGVNSDGMATVDFANKLPEGTKVVQDGKEIDIKTPGSNSNASSSLNASSNANGSSNASSASSSSVSSNASSASNGNSTVSSGDVNQTNTAQTNKNGSEITVKENTPFTVELPKQQAFKTDGTATPDKPLSVKVTDLKVGTTLKFGVQTYSGGGQHSKIETQNSAPIQDVVGSKLTQQAATPISDNAQVKPTDKLGMAYQPKASSSSTTTNTTGSQNQGQNENQNQSQGQQGKTATLANTQGNRFNITSTIMACLTAIAAVFTGSLAYVLKRKHN